MISLHVGSLQVSQAREKAESVFKDVLARKVLSIVLIFDLLFHSKDTADATRNALSVLTRFKFIFFLPKQIDENMAKVLVLFSETV